MWMGSQSPMVRLEAGITCTLMLLAIRKKRVGVAVHAQGEQLHLHLWVLITIASQAPPDGRGMEHSFTIRTFYGTDSSVVEMRSRAAIHQTFRGSVRRSQLPSLRTWRFRYARMKGVSMTMWQLSHFNGTF